MQILPIAPPWATTSQKRKALAAASAAYMAAFKAFEARSVFGDIVSTMHSKELVGLQGPSRHKALADAGYVKIGKARYGTNGYTSIYVREAIAKKYPSPTAAYKEYLKCVKN